MPPENSLIPKVEEFCDVSDKVAKVGSDELTLSIEE
jgi:hypothetical protein